MFESCGWFECPWVLTRRPNIAFGVCACVYLRTVGYPFVYLSIRQYFLTSVEDQKGFRYAKIKTGLAVIKGRQSASVTNEKYTNELCCFFIN